MHLSFDFIDGFGAANVTYGHILDAAQTPESLRVGALVTNGIVTLVANKGINELGADPGADIRAGTFLLSAGTGIGALGAIEFLSGVVEAETNTGGIDLRAFNSVQVGGSSADINGLQVVTAGNVKLVANGTIFLSETNPPAGPLELVKAGDTNGNVTLTALGFTANIITNTDLDAVTAPRGQIVLEAGQDVAFGTVGVDFDNDVRANDFLKITAGRDVLVDGFADISSDDFFQNTGGDLTIIAGRNIHVRNIAGSDASLTASGSAGADVRLTTGFGGAVILDAPSPTAVSSNSGDIIVEADRLLVSTSSGMSSPAGTITIRPRAEGRAIILGSASDAAAAVEIADSELDRLFTDGLTIGGVDAGAVTVISSISPIGSPDLTLRSGSKIQLNAGVGITVADTLTFRSGGDIVIAGSAAIFAAVPLFGFVDDDGADGGVGGQALVGAAFAQSLNLTGNDDNDTLQGGAAADTLNGGAGVDSMLGRGGNDTYVATAGDNITEAVGEGEDTVQAAVDFSLGANLENLTLLGSADLDGTGNELDNRISGNAGDNLLDGGAEGDDIINGFAGQDTLSGGTDNDRLNGGGNKDLLSGGGKNDTLSGGGAQDRFRFDTAPNTASNNDEIIDYVVADDTVELENAVFTSLAAGLLPANQFVSGAAAVDGNDFIIHNSATGAIFYDPDGNGAAPAIQFASVTPGLILSRFDFFVT